MKAVTFASRKWPHHAERDVTLVRASVGRVDDDRLADLDDAALLRRVDDEVRRTTGLPRGAVASAVQRWPDALPQYEVGHLARVATVRQRVAEALPGLHLAGAAYDGVGLAARAAESEELARALRGDDT